MNIALNIVWLCTWKGFFLKFHLVTERETLSENFCFCEQKDKKDTVHFVCHSEHDELEVSK